LITGSQVLNQDASLASFCPQYRVSLHLWLALHVHRREDAHQTSLVAHHCELSWKTLKSSFVGPPTAEASPKHKKPPPAKKQGALAKGKSSTGMKTNAARKGPVVKSIKNLDPVTPKPRNGMELHITFNFAF
jgi:separase